MNNPQTPGGGLGVDFHNEWCTPDLIVKIRSSSDLKLRGQIGEIRTVTNQTCSIFLPDEDRVMTVPSSQLEPVTPQLQDPCKLIYGDDREATGILLQMSAKDATVLINKEKRMVPLSHVCKIKSDKD
jgi:hypothetical protein